MLYRKIFSSEHLVFNISLLNMDLILTYGSGTVEDNLSSLPENINASNKSNCNNSFNNELLNSNQNLEISVFSPDVEIVQNFENIGYQVKEPTFLSAVQKMINTEGNPKQKKGKENRLSRKIKRCKGEAYTTET